MLGKVDSKWFTEWWNKDVQSKIDSRPRPFSGYQNSNTAASKDKTINNIIFEAMGSTRNFDDFLLCEDAINSFKAKLWANQGPVQAQKWKDIAKSAASGPTSV